MIFSKVESIDDNEELEYTEDAFNVLGFAEQEKFDCYTLTAGVMTCGGIEFKTKGRDDQAECENVGPDRCKTFLDQVQTQHFLCSATPVRRPPSSESMLSR